LEDLFNNVLHIVFIGVPCNGTIFETVVGFWSLSDNWIRSSGKACSIYRQLSSRKNYRWCR